jgi:hypothetical protein
MLRQLAGLAGTLPLIVLLAACGQVATSTLGDNGSSAVAPTITQQPAAQSVTAGATASFSVAAAGSTPLNYQWNKNGSAIPGAVSPSYSTAAAPEDDGATFDVVVSNPIGSAQSSAAQLHVTAAPEAPAITTQPAAQRIIAGQSTTFSVVATGTSPLSYQWQENGTAIPAATSASYTTPAASSADNGALFSVVVSNSVGSLVSASAPLTVTEGGGVAPTITAQPADQTINAGQSATFTVMASGSAPLSYQWQKNGTALAAATSASYTTPPETTADNGAHFAVLVSDAAGSDTSRAARLAVTAAPSPPPPPPPPVILTQPANQSVLSGQRATFSVSASGSAPLSYQWRKNGAAIAAATSASYTTPPETAADNGASFAVLVSDAAGSVTSRAANLTVNAPPPAPPPPPTILTQPANQGVLSGQSATFSVSASGSAPLSYQWRKNGTAISGANAASYTTPAETSSDNGALFAVIVTNPAGSVTSRNALLTVSASVPGTDVVTYKNDLARTGQNLTERTLTTANVAAATFGKLRFLSTDGKVDAQPLYLSALNVGGAPHNVVFVAPENDSVYAFDADSSTQLWRVSLIPGGEAASGPLNCDQVTPTIGITSTPVIDRSAGPHGAIYVVAMTQSKSGRTYHQRLHALDVTTGAELSGGPTEITASYAASSGTLTFDPQQYEERAALLLLNGTIYTAWTSHCDNKFYTGWLMAYSQSTLAQTAVLNVAPNSAGLGPAIWMSGGGPAADSSGNIYLLTANGAFEETLSASGFPNMGDFGNSFLKLSTTGGALNVADYFSPSVTTFLSNNDLDLGSGGILLLPDLTDAGGTLRHLAVGAGKDGNIYVVNRDAMGHFSASSNNIWQQLSSVLGNVLAGGGSGGVWSTPAYFNGRLYYGPGGGQLAAFSIGNAKLSTTPSSVSAANFTYPGTSPAISANGTTNGIVWAHMNSDPAVLYAFDATNLGSMLYNSSEAPGGRDQFGAGNKFITPMIADGKVFVGTTNGVAVFGLLH